MEFSPACAFLLPSSCHYLASLPVVRNSDSRGEGKRKPCLVRGLGALPPIPHLQRGRQENHVSWHDVWEVYRHIFTGLLR
eukprot:scaffold155883_cov28-Tisochrysis_lutea.AAC.1